MYCNTFYAKKMGLDCCWDAIEEVWFILAQKYKTNKLLIHTSLESASSFSSSPTQYALIYLNYRCKYIMPQGATKIVQIHSHAKCSFLDCDQNNF